MATGLVFRILFSFLPLLLKAQLRDQIARMHLMSELCWIAVRLKLYEFSNCSIPVTTMNIAIVSQAVPTRSQNARTDRVVFQTTGSATDTRIAMTEATKLIAVK